MRSLDEMKAAIDARSHRPGDVMVTWPLEDIRQLVDLADEAFAKLAALEELFETLGRAEAGQVRLAPVSIGAARTLSERSYDEPHARELADAARAAIHRNQQRGAA